jgi:hypothetical protein
MNPTLKHYIISSIITFLAFFAIAILPSLSTLTLADIQHGALAAILFSGLRAGLKAVVEGFIAWYQKTNQS